MSFSSSASEAVGLLHGYSNLFVVYDKAAGAFVSNLLKCAEGNIRATLAITGGEQAKTPAGAEGIISWLMDSGAGRDAVLVGIGGGSVCDASAFVASIYKRGVPHILIPTTLLAQADAAIGGKTALNIGGVKNVVGTFAWPEFTCLCPEPLETLPYNEILSGVAELVKTFILSGTHYQETINILSGHHPRPASDGSFIPSIWPLVAEAAKFKARIVSDDPYDKSVRQTLNLGHTFGHAIEALTQKPHGQAVAIGIILAAALSESLGKAECGLVARLRRDFISIGLETECPIPLDLLKEKLSHDKKTSGNKINFILPCGIGRVERIPLEADYAISLINNNSEAVLK